MTNLEMEQYSDDQKYDICTPENEWILADIQNRAAIGTLIMRLREKALQAGQPLYVSGLNSVPTVTYNGEEVAFIPGFSHDPEGMAPSHSSYTVSPREYKKPWLQEALKEIGLNFLHPSRLNCRDLFLEVLEEDINLDVLGGKHPGEKPSTLFNRFRSAVQHHLATIFRLPLSANSPLGPELEFVSMDLKSKYLANDPALMEEIKDGLIMMKNELGL